MYDLNDIIDRLHAVLAENFTCIKAGDIGSNPPYVVTRPSNMTLTVTADNLPVVHTWQLTSILITGYLGEGLTGDLLEYSNEQLAIFFDLIYTHGDLISDTYPTAPDYLFLPVVITGTPGGLVEVQHTGLDVTVLGWIINMEVQLVHGS